MRLVPPTGSRIAAILGIAFCVLIARAEAQEYCIACSQPSAMYRCVIEGARPGGQPLQMQCVTAMLKEGPHSSCSPKGGTVFDCNGPVKRVPWTAAALPAAKPTPPPAAKVPDRPPQTVEEMAKRVNERAAEDLTKANDNTKEQAKSLDQNVGDAAKKTWRCLSSLLTNCTE